MKELLDFYLTIFKLQDRCRSEIEKTPSVDKKSAEERLEKSRPLLKSSDIPIDPHLFKKFLQDLCELVSTQSGRKTRLDRFLSDNELSPENLEDFLAQARKNDLTYLEGLSNRSKTSKELVYFVVQGALTPFYQKAAQAVSSRFDFSNWSAGFCPVCGHLALAAKWSGEGDFKILECSLCGSQWKHVLNKCPFCDNDNPEELLYFSSGEDKGHGLLVCQNCQVYLKISNEKELEREVVLPVEQVVTVYLDQYAKKEGYQYGAEQAGEVD